MLQGNPASTLQAVDSVAFSEQEAGAPTDAAVADPTATAAVMMHAHTDLVAAAAAAAASAAQFAAPAPPAPKAAGTKKHGKSSTSPKLASGGGKGKPGKRGQGVACQLKPGLCSFCGETQSPLWRKGPEEYARLCNACGMRYSRAKAQNDVKKAFTDKILAKILQERNNNLATQVSKQRVEFKASGPGQQYFHVCPEQQRCWSSSFTQQCRSHA